MTKNNTSGMFLSAVEIRELTGRVHSISQLKVLRSMGIEHRPRPDASIAVLRQHVEEILGARLDNKTRKVREPNWEAIHAKST